MLKVKNSAFTTDSVESVLTNLRQRTTEKRHSGLIPSWNFFQSGRGFSNTEKQNNAESRKQKPKGIVMLPRLTPRQRAPPDSSLRLWRVSMLLCDMGSFARWRVHDVNPTHTCQNATTLAGAGRPKSLLRENPVCNHSAPITNLQKHPRIWGHPNMVITLQFLEGWSWELSSSLVCAVYLLSVCPSVDMENRRSSIILWRPHWKLARITIIWHYPAVSREFNQSNNSEGWQRRVTSSLCCNKL